MHTHNFVENYKGLVGYGADRETDENTLIYYLQKFSDDNFMALMAKRMTDAEMMELFDLINRLLSCQSSIGPGCHGPDHQAAVG